MKKDYPEILALLRSKLKRVLVVFAAMIAACLVSYEIFAYRTTAEVRQYRESSVLAEFSLCDFVAIFAAVALVGYLAVIIVTVSGRLGKKRIADAAANDAASEKKQFLDDIASCACILFLFWAAVVLMYGVIDLVNSAPRYLRNGSQDAAYALLFRSVFYGLIPLHSPLLWVRNVCLVLCGGTALASVLHCRGNRVVLALGILALITVPIAFPGEFPGTDVIPLDREIGLGLHEERPTAVLLAEVSTIAVAVLSIAAALMTRHIFRAENAAQDGAAEDSKNAETQDDASKNTETQNAASQDFVQLDAAAQKEKSLVPVILAGILLIAGALATSLTLRSKETKSTLVETTTKGSPEAADGLRITMKESFKAIVTEYTSSQTVSYEEWSSRLWNNTYRFGRNGFEGITKVTQITGGDLESRDACFEEEARRDESEGTTGYRMGRYWYGTKIAEVALPDVFWEKIDAAKGRATIRLSDYIDYYPLIDEICVDDLKVFDYRITADSKYWETFDAKWNAAIMEAVWLNKDIDYDNMSEEDNQEVRRRMTAVSERLNGFFRIPVLPDETLEISSNGLTTSAYEEQKYERTISYAQGTDYYDPRTMTVCTDDAFLFTFTTHTNDGAVVDTSLIPGGYGVYTLPYAKYEGETYTPGVDLDELRLFYPLDPNSEIDDFTISPDRTKLFVVYTLDGRSRLLVLDTKTGAALGDAETGIVVPNGDGNVHCYGFAENDFYCATLALTQESIKRLDTKTIVVAPDAAGVWNVAMLCDDEDTVLSIMTEKTYFAFDGKRLVQVVPSFYNSGCITITVISEEGIVYEGVVSDSFPYASGRYAPGTGPQWDIEVSWEQAE
ncbi:MAG: hypothetical protein IKX54_04905 [Lachnospiraceae bacterium]|nr:hypothetical protein [Lachnospiraceae bacterium]